MVSKDKYGLPKWLSGKESACQCRRHRRCEFDTWMGKSHWKREWQHTPVFLPGKFHGERSLAGYSSEGHKELTWLSRHAISDLRLLKSCLVIVTLYIPQSQQSHWPINVFAYLSHLINSEIWGVFLKVRTVSHLFLCSQVLEKLLSMDTSNG